MPSIEQKILVAAADLDPDSDRLDHLQRHVFDDVDAGKLFHLAVKEGMGGFFYRGLSKAGALDRLSGEYRARLESIYYQTIRLNLKLLHDVKKVLRQLDKDKIRVVLMQGISLLPQVYSDIGLRPMKDIDLWVMPEEFRALTNALIGLGFQKGKLYPKTFKKGDTCIDIHTHLLWADRIKARSKLLKKDQQFVFNDARTIEVEGQKALILNPYDQVLYLSLHAIKHYAERLIWLVDVKSIIRDWKPSQWVEFKKRAVELGLENVISYSKFLLSDLLNYQLPAEAQLLLENLRPGFLEKIVLKKRKKEGALPVWSTLLLLPGGKGWRQRVAYTFEELFPRPEVLRQVFAYHSGLKVWQLYWRRSLQLMGLLKH
jgi:hypothetical protein